MGALNSGISAIGKLAVVAILLAAFGGASAAVVYWSLKGEELTVPEITGKDFFESEKELAGMGLKIKRRAERPSTEKMNTVIEQSPKAGETVKTGQLIFVVVSKAGVEGEEAPKSLIKDLETDDSQKIEELISDKPKKPKANTNSNAKKKAETTRDVGNTETNSNSSDKANSKSDDPEKKPDNAKEPEKGNRNTSTTGAPKTQPNPAKPAVKDPRPRNPQQRP